MVLQKKISEDDIQIIELDDFPQSIKDSKYFYNLEFHSPFKKLSLPQNTTIKFIPPSSANGSSQPKAEIHLEKRSFFNVFRDFHIIITVFYSAGSVGLNEIGRYVGVVAPGQRAIVLNDEENRKYWSTNLIVTYEANFGHFRPWSEDVLTYKEWIEELFKAMKSDFDWRLQDEKIRYYLQVTSYEKIIHQMK